MRDLTFFERPMFISLADDNRLRLCSKCDGKPIVTVKKNPRRQIAEAVCTHCLKYISIEHHGGYDGDIETEIIKEWNND